ncbi:MAG TPA: hypothetical protein VFV65_04635 [Gemmatimonadales bacterium]|nr:hypothetical protein [Gemmatimonadales bacterium]
MTDRRYSEAEVAEIFRQAAEAQQSAQRRLPPGDGLTLSDLQGIGQDVGIPPDLIAQAATTLERGGLPASRRFLGLPLGVGRTVELPRPLTEAEWEHLVVDLRDTFHARGTIRSDGGLREWTNGNLQALLEPTPTGARLRLRTLNGNARGLMLVGMGMIGIALGPFIAAVLTVGAEAALPQLLPFLLGGGALFGLGALRLPRWATARRRQMEEVTARLTTSTSGRLGAGQE